MDPNFMFDDGFQDPFSVDQERRKKLYEDQSFQAPQQIVQPVHEHNSNIEPPRNAVQQRYQDVLSQAPKQADYKPGILRTILGGLTGALTKNPELGSSVVNSKYNRALNDWQTQAKAAQMGAQADIAERGSGIKQGQLQSIDEYRKGRMANEAEKRRQGDEQLAILRSEHERKVAQGDEANRIAAQREADYKANNTAENLRKWQEANNQKKHWDDVIAQSKAQLAAQREARATPLVQAKLKGLSFAQNQVTKLKAARPFIKDPEALKSLDQSIKDTDDFIAKTEQEAQVLEQMQAALGSAGVSYD